MTQSKLPAPPSPKLLREGEIDEQEFLDQIADVLSTAIRAATEAERQRCAKITSEWLSGPTMVLRAGEMTAQEKRTALAIVASIDIAIREPNRVH